MSTDITFDIRDEYKRKAIAEKIISLLESNIPVSPMVIDGDWKNRVFKKVSILN
ncbi:TPA: hypothetical protein ACG6V0_000751 [Escherichia coli]